LYPEQFYWQIAAVILGIVSVLLLFTVKNSLGKLVLFSWLVIGIVLFGFYKKDIYDYYLGFMFPLPFLLTGNVFAYLFTNDYRKKIGIGIAMIVFTGIFLFNLNANPFRHPPNRQKDQVKTIAEFIIEKSEKKPYNFALITGGNSDHGYRYYLDILGHPPIVIKNEALDPGRETVTDHLFVVCEQADCKPLGNGLWEVAGFGRAEIDDTWRVSVVDVYKLRHFRE
jgi:hypothetical protein